LQVPVVLHRVPAGSGSYCQLSPSQYAVLQGTCGVGPHKEIFESILPMDSLPPLQLGSTAKSVTKDRWRGRKIILGILQMLVTR
jgi:hypothetical protein